MSLGSISIPDEFTGLTPAEKGAYSELIRKINVDGCKTEVSPTDREGYTTHFHSATENNQYSHLLPEYRGFIAIDIREYSFMIDNLPDTCLMPETLSDFVKRPELLLILAHEFGHYQSFTGGHSPDPEIFARFNQRGPGSLSDLEKQLFLLEEERAWDFAGGTLPEVHSGFDRAAFERFSSDCLASYRDLLYPPT